MARSLPRYYLLKERILELIDGADVGSPIPPERVLAEQWSTSRTTVRQALTELVAEGRLERTQGRGTFVAPPKLTQVRQLTSFSEDGRLTGSEVGSELIAVERVQPHRVVAARLGTRPGQQVWCVERVRLVGGAPLAHETAYLRGRLPGLDRHLETAGSLYAMLRDVYGIVVNEVEDSVETMPADPEEARLLRVPTGSPLLLVHRLALDESGRPVEWTRSTFRGDRFRFVAKGRRSH